MVGYGAPKISPDGRKVVYEQTTTNWETSAFELRQALEDKGVPVKMVLYDGFGHPINNPKQQRAVMEENENWFGHYIFGEPLAPALTPEVKPAAAP